MANKSTKKHAKLMSIRDKVPPPRDEFGIGYFKPISMPASTFLQTIKTWQDKLAQSGFVDIETHSFGKLGTVVPHFQSDGRSMSNVGLYNKATEDYYSLAREFYWAFDWRSAFRGNAPLMRFIWLGVAEGVPYREIVKRLAKKPVAKTIKLAMPLPPHFERIKQDKSLYWLYCRIQEIYPLFKQWRDSRPETSD